MERKTWVLIGFIIVAQFFLLMGLKFTAWPEMTLWPYLITKGWFPYTDIAIAHTPLLLVKLSIFYKLFGVGIIQLKIFTWLVILFADFLIYFITSKMWGKKVAFLSLIAYALSLIFYDGNGLWFDLMLAPLALVTFYLTENKKWFLAGVFWALMFLTKQTSVWFLIPVALVLVKGKRQEIKVRFAKTFLGISTIIILFVLLLFTFHLLPSFYNWAIKFGIFVLPKAQGQIQLPDLKTLIVAGFPFLIFVPFIFSKQKNKNLILWALAGVMGAYPRFEYFHFQPGLPFLAIAIAIIFSEWKKYAKLLKIILIIWTLGILYLFVNYFVRNWHEGDRFHEEDVQDTVLYVRENTKPRDKIFVLNWWDNIYALTDTLPSVKPWVPQLSWYMENPGIQEKMIENLKNDTPKLIIFNDYTDIGLSAYIPTKVYNYVLENYHSTDKIGETKILIPNIK